MQNLQNHFGAHFNADSKVLILGSFPSKSSMDARFFYQNSTNRFWLILPKLFGEKCLIDDIAAQKAFLKAHKIALWDIFTKCYKDPANSALDKDIVDKKSEKSNLSEILNKSQISHIFTTIGKTGNLTKWRVKEWVQRYFPSTNINEIFHPLYSTSMRSPKTNEELLDDYKIIKETLDRLK